METQVLNDTIHQMDLIDIHRIFHPKVAEYTFFSSARGTFSRIDYKSWVRDQASENLRKLKSYQASFLTTALRDWKSIIRKKLGITQIHGG